MKFVKIISIALLGAVLAFSSCKKTPVQEEENINVIKLQVGSATYTWSDTDGTGGAAPKIDTIRIAPNATNDYTLSFSDGSVTPAKDLTTEIVSEKNDHLVIFKPTSATLTFSGLSKDGNGKDFGQTGKVASGAASTGSLQVLLIHLPDKSAADPSKTGTQDVSIIFPVVVK